LSLGQMGMVTVSVNCLILEEWCVSVKANEKGRLLSVELEEENDPINCLVSLVYRLMTKKIFMLLISRNARIQKFDLMIKKREKFFVFEKSDVR
jgi:hypothetical protein